MDELPFAEDVNYWMTSSASPDTWMDKTMKLIVSFGGTVISEAFGSQQGRAAFLLVFELGDDRFKIVWPVLPTRGKNERAARIQAATMIYHDVKAKCLAAEVLGVRAAFFSYLMLPDGRTTVQASVPELSKGIPAWFDHPRLENGE